MIGKCIRLGLSPFLEVAWVVASGLLALACLAFAAIAAPIGWLAWLLDFGDMEQRIENNGDLYLHRKYLSPRLKKLYSLRLPGLFLHTFNRGDRDRHCHDHPWWFLTYPLTGYYEVMLTEKGEKVLRWIAPFRFHFRASEHIHRVIGSVARPVYEWYSSAHYTGPVDWEQPEKDRKLWTLIIHGRAISGKWGFWVEADDPKYKGLYIDHGTEVHGYRKVYWRKYDG